MKYHDRLLKEISKATGQPMNSFRLAWLHIGHFAKFKYLISKNRNSDFSRGGLFRRKSGKLWVATEAGENAFKRWKVSPEGPLEAIGKWLWNKITGNA